MRTPFHNNGLKSKKTKGVRNVIIPNPYSLKLPLKGISFFFAHRGLFNKWQINQIFRVEMML